MGVTIMINLIKLEIKKNRLIKTLKAVGIANIAIIGFLALIFLTERGEDVGAFETYESAFSVIDTFVRATFMMFASVWISKLIIDEYKTKTISLLFMYPLNRKKIIFSKLLIVFIYTFCCVLFSNLFISQILIVFNPMFEIVSGSLSASILAKDLLNIIVSALSTAGMSLIPLYFGMLKKSVPATIVSALLLNTLATSNWGQGTSIYKIVLIPIMLGVIGILIAYLTIRKIDKKDVL